MAEAIAESENDVRPNDLLEKLEIVGLHTVFVEDVVLKFFFKVCFGCSNDSVEALSGRKVSQTTDNTSPTSISDDQ